MSCTFKLNRCQVTEVHRWYDRCDVPTFIPCSLQADLRPNPGYSE